MGIKEILGSKLMSYACLILSSLLFLLLFMQRLMRFSSYQIYYLFYFFLIVLPVLCICNFYFSPSKKLPLAAVITICAAGFVVRAYMIFFVLGALLMVWLLKEKLKKSAFSFSMTALSLFLFITVLYFILEYTEDIGFIGGLLPVALLLPVAVIVFSVGSIVQGIVESLPGNHLKPTIAIIIGTLISIILIFAFASFTRPDTHFPERCVGIRGLDCVDKACIEDGIIKFVLMNNMGEKIRMLDGFEGSGECIDKGKIMLRIFDEKTNEMKESTEFPVIINEDESFTIEVDCGVYQSGRVRQSITLFYEKGGKNNSLPVEISGYSSISKTNLTKNQLILSQKYKKTHILELISVLLPYIGIILLLIVCCCFTYFRPDAAKVGMAFLFFIAAHIATFGIFLQYYVEYNIARSVFISAPVFFNGPMTLFFGIILSFSGMSISNIELAVFQLIDFILIYALSCFIISKWRKKLKIS